MIAHDFPPVLLCTDNNLDKEPEFEKPQQAKSDTLLTREFTLSISSDSEKWCLLKAKVQQTLEKLKDLKQQSPHCLSTSAEVKGIVMELLSQVKECLESTQLEFLSDKV